MMKVLFSGFEPFGDSPINPSRMLVNDLVRMHFPGMECRAVILPVDRERGPLNLLSAVDSFQPDAVVSFGLAAGRPRISLERVAINLMDFRIPDNAGNLVNDQPIVPNGPAAYFSTLPLQKLFDAIRNNDLPVEFSLSAGAYLCNQVFYVLMHHISETHKPIIAGFIHLPALPEQAAQSQQTMPSMDFSLMKKAAGIIVAVLSEGQEVKDENN